mmetsp:Transcript_10165/g.41169  ORF Transcript_10165/g.41169 Transcript_10165/m.41169 type:complete len:299 (+) Transcript_10165:269-1165(+)
MEHDDEETRMPHGLVLLGRAVGVHNERRDEDEDDLYLRDERDGVVGVLDVRREVGIEPPADHCEEHRNDALRQRVRFEDGDNARQADAAEAVVDREEPAPRLDVLVQEGVGSEVVVVITIAEDHLIRLRAQHLVRAAAVPEVVLPRRRRLDAWRLVLVILRMLGVRRGRRFRLRERRVEHVPVRDEDGRKQERHTDRPRSHRADDDGPERTPAVVVAVDGQVGRQEPEVRLAAAALKSLALEVAERERGAVRQRDVEDEQDDVDCHRPEAFLVVIVDAPQRAAGHRGEAQRADVREED